MHSEILKPVVVLIAWTLVMLVWMLSTRLPAMRASGVDITKLVGTVNRRANGTPYRRAKGTPFSRWLKVDRTRAFALRAA